MKVQGFTLIESMVAMSLFAVMALGSLTAFMALLNYQTATSIQQETQQSTREAMDVMTKLIRNSTIITIPGATTEPEIGNSIIVATPEIGYSGTINVCNVGSFDNALCIGTEPIVPFDKIRIVNLRFSRRDRVVRITIEAEQRRNNPKPFEMDNTRLETSVLAEQLP